MRPGDTVWGHRIVTVGTTRDGVLRCRAVAAETSVAWELLVWRGQDARARAAFESGHRWLATARDPGLIHVRSVHPEVDRVGVVRPLLLDETLERLQGPVAPAVVAGVGATLIPALLAASEVSGELVRPEDIGVTEAGRPILAPRLGGLAPPGSAADRLSALGRLLYRWWTGRSVGSGPTVPPTAVRPDLDPRVDAIFALLTSEDPGRRITALPLLRALAAPDLDLRPLVSRHPSSFAVVTTRAADGVPARSAPTVGGALVLVPAEEMRRLAPPDRSRLAARAGLPDRLVQDLTRRGLPVVLETATGGRAAATRADRLARELGVAVAPADGPWLPAAAARTLGWVLGATLFAVALVLAVLGAVPLAAAAAATAAVSAVSGEAFARRAARRQALHTGGVESWSHVAASLEDRSLAGRLDRAWEAVGRTRTALASSPLPDLVASDVRAVLARCEDELEALSSPGTGPSDGEARAVGDRVIADADALTRLLGRLAKDDEDALAELAHRVRGEHGRAP